MQPVTMQTTFDTAPLKIQRAIDHYIDTGEIAESYRLCKPSSVKERSVSSYASEFFRRPEIVALVRERRDQILASQRFTKEELIQKIQAIADGLVEDQYSSKTSVKDRLEASKLLAKITGVLDERATTNVNVGVQFVNDIKE